MKIISAAAILMMLSSTCMASEPQCYERTYDTPHLQKHKLQEVVKIRLELLSSETGHIKASFRELPDYLQSEITCDAKQNSTTCTVDDSGGSFNFVPTAKGIKLRNTSRIRFGGEDDGVIIGREAEHQLFILFQIPCGN